MKRGRGLRQVSDRKKAEDIERRAVVDAVRARDQGCVVKGIPAAGRCGGQWDAHEIIPRSAWRGGYLVVDNVVIVCRAHHDWIGDHPDEAHGYGLHGYSWEVPR